MSSSSIAKQPADYVFHGVEWCVNGAGKKNGGEGTCWVTDCTVVVSPSGLVVDKSHDSVMYTAVSSKDEFMKQQKKQGVSAGLDWQRAASSPDTSLSVRTRDISFVYDAGFDTHDPELLQELQEYYEFFHHHHHNQHQYAMHPLTPLLGPFVAAYGPKIAAAQQKQQQRTAQHQSSSPPSSPHLASLSSAEFTVALQRKLLRLLVESPLGQRSWRYSSHPVDHNVHAACDYALPSASLLTTAQTDADEDVGAASINQHQQQQQLEEGELQQGVTTATTTTQALRPFIALRFSRDGSCRYVSDILLLRFPDAREAQRWLDVMRRCLCYHHAEKLFHDMNSVLLPHIRSQMTATRATNQHFSTATTSTTKAEHKTQPIESERENDAEKKKSAGRGDGGHEAAMMGFGSVRPGDFDDIPNDDGEEAGEGQEKEAVQRSKEEEEEEKAEERNEVKDAQPTSENFGAKTAEAEEATQREVIRGFVMTLQSLHPLHQLGILRATMSDHIFRDYVNGLKRTINVPKSQSPSQAVVGPPESSLSQKFFRFTRRLVSKKKQRYQADGYDLDLSYIHTNIIALGFPCRDDDVRFRNPMEEVVRFFETNHGGKYRIYNLCSERYYDPLSFGGAFERYPSDDHQPPPLQLIFDFVRSAAGFLVPDDQERRLLNKRAMEHGCMPPREEEEGESAANAAATVAQACGNRMVGVHCKAGKSRTGVMIIALMLYLNIFRSVNKAITHYNTRRTKDGKGITIPSQKRFLHYFKHTLLELKGDVPRVRPVALISLVLHTIPRFDLDGGCTPYVIVEARCSSHAHRPAHQRELFCGNEMAVVFDSREHYATRHIVGEDSFEFPLHSEIVENEVRFSIFTRRQKAMFQKKDEKICSFWLHTSFVDSSIGSVSLTQRDLDGANKATKDLFDDDFCVKLHFFAQQPRQHQLDADDGAVSSSLPRDFL